MEKWTLRPGLREEDVPARPADVVDTDDAYLRTRLRDDMGLVGKLYSLDHALSGAHVWPNTIKRARPEERPAYEAVAAMIERHRAEVRQFIEQWVNHGARPLRTPEQVTAAVTAFEPTTPAG